MIVLLTITAFTLMWSGFVWVGYLALEPIVRRRWPDRLISWTRILAGDWRNPMVGRDVLFGAALGLFMLAGSTGRVWLTSRRGGQEGVRLAPSVALEGLRDLAALPGDVLLTSIVVSLSVLVFIVLISMFVRRDDIAVAVFVVLLMGVVCLREGTLAPPMVALAALSASSFTLAVARLGLVAGVTSHAVFLLLLQLPLTTDMSAWYLPAALAGVAMVVGMATFGAITAVGGRRVFDRLLPE